MAWKKKASGSDDNGDPSARLVTAEADIAKAGKWFARGLELGEKRQFEYAIEYYVNGLEFWPDAVEDACKPLHGCAVARLQTGGKKAGLKDTMKRSLSDKNPKQAFLNAMWLFGHDPENMSYAEAMTRNAGRLRAEDAAQWAAGVFLKALEVAPKASTKCFQSFVRLVEELADRAAKRGEVTFAVSTYETVVSGVNLWRRRNPKEKDIEDTLRNLSTKLTILKGRYTDGESFRDSMVDSESQADLHDKDRSVQSDERLDELIAVAQQECTNNAEDSRLVKNYIDLLCRREREDEEIRAIGVAVQAYKQTSDYRWKQMADDIRIKQLGRRGRELKKSGDQPAYKVHWNQQITFEMAVYKERVKRYPTDNRLKFELGVRFFRTRRYDEAIPLFQTARSDPRNRVASGLYLGRCFYRKDYHSQAIPTFEKTISEYEITDDDMAKNLQYWLARSQQASLDHQSAKETYGKILQLDYNYRDVRARLDSLPSRGQTPADGE